MGTRNMMAARENASLQAKRATNKMSSNRAALGEIGNKPVEEKVHQKNLKPLLTKTFVPPEEYALPSIKVNDDVEEEVPVMRLPKMKALSDNFLRVSLTSMPWRTRTILSCV